MSLVTGDIVTKAPHYWTQVMLSDATIARVEIMAQNQNQPLLRDSNLLSEWSPDQIIDDDEYDPDFVPPPPSPSDADADDDNDDLSYDSDSDLAPNILESPPAPLPTIAADPFPADTTDTFDTLGAPTNTSDTTDTPGAPTDTSDAQAAPTDHSDAPPAPTAPATLEPSSQTDPIDDTHTPQSQGAPPVTTIVDTQANPTPVNIQPSSEHPYNLRQHRDRSYDHRLSHAMDSPANSQSYEPNDGTSFFQTHPITPHMQKTIHGWVMTQMSAKAGYRRFGNAARDAMRKEFRQLDDKGVFDPINPSTITKSTRKQALRCINIIKEKRCGKIKGRTCADGRPQRNLYDKTETSSPTASSDAIMLTLIVDAMERRDVATADVAGAYLNAEMDD